MAITARCALLGFGALICASTLAAQVCHSPAQAAPASGRGGVVVPIRIEGGGVFVPVVLNDGNTYSFLLDSGFEESVIDPATVRGLKLTQGQEHKESAPGGEVKVSSVENVQRSVAGVNLGKGTVSALDLSGFDPLFGHHLDGVLGYDFFQQFVVILDYEHRQVTLCDSVSFRPKVDKPVQLHLDSKQPYVDVEMEGVKGAPIHAALEIDTGKVDPFSVSAAFARKNGLLGDASKLLALKGVSLGGETQA